MAEPSSQDAICYKPGGGKFATHSWKVRGTFAGRYIYKAGGGKVAKTNGGKFKGRSQDEIYINKPSGGKFAKHSWNVCGTTAGRNVYKPGGGKPAKHSWNARRTIYL